MTHKPGARQIFAADFASLRDMDEQERDDVFEVMAHDAIVAANKIRAANGKKLFETDTVDKVVDILRRRPDLRAMRDRPELDHLL